MANWCLNTVVFQGESHRIEELRLLTEKLMEREGLGTRGQLYPVIDEKSGYLFDIQYQDCVLCYFTKWSPNTQVLIRLADQLNLSYTHDYLEPAMMIYGRDIYKNGQLLQAMLDKDDFALYAFIRETSSCELKPERYPSDPELLDVLFRRKLALIERDIKPGG